MKSILRIRNLLLKSVIVIGFIYFSGHKLYAFEADPLNNFSVSKDEISQSLDKMKVAGKINEEEYKIAKRELASLNDEKLTALNEKAKNLIRTDPDAAVNLYENKNIKSNNLLHSVQAIEQAPK